MTPQAVAAIASQHANEFFHPRSVAPPQPELIQTSSIMGRPGTRNARMGFSTPIRTSIDENSPLPSNPRPGPSGPASIIEDARGEATASQVFAMDYTPQLAIDQEIPPSPGPGWSHRPSVATHANNQFNSLVSNTTRPSAAQQRFQSLSFENEEEMATSALAMERNSRAPPPDYEGSGEMRNRPTPSAPVPVPPAVSQSGVQRVDRRRWRDLTGSRPRA